MIKMPTKKPDRRIAKTRDALGNTLFALMQTEPWNNITIMAICDAANVARASFYAHFESKLDLLESILEERIPRPADLSRFLGDQQPIEFLLWLVDHVSANRALFAKIISLPEAAPVFIRFKAVIVIRQAALLRDTGVDDADMRARFVVGGTLDLLQHWAKTWRKDQIAKLKVDVAAFSGAVFGR
jgi:AcrR family transcriptional regulator